MVFGIILEQREEEQKDGKNDVPTSRCPNVATSGQREEEVNK